MNRMCDFDDVRVVIVGQDPVPGFVMICLGLLSILSILSAILSYVEKKRLSVRFCSEKKLGRGRRLYQFFSLTHSHSLYLFADLLYAHLLFPICLFTC